MTEPAGRIPELAANKEDSDRLKLLPYIAEDLPDAELEQLRRMLFAREIELLEKLARRQGEKHSERVSEVLAESFTMRAGKDNQLNLALEPVVDKIFKDSLNRRKNDFVNLLFPLIGPVIRKSIAESFLSMLGNFSQSLDVAFSWRGLKWRLEALRSGRPFNEIVLLHTVLYRVEQVFFIHSETGLALNHAVNEEITGKDADMVSGMLTAIQDFARDSFSGGSEDHLDSLKMGELLLIIEKREQAYLACVVRGTPPADLRKDLQETLDLMLVEYSVPLDEFSGDTAPFITAVRYLQPLLSS
ncbi:MAG: flagellar motor protein MotB, partial [Deltaproteobacteria bacterium]